MVCRGMGLGIALLEGHEPLVALDGLSRCEQWSAIEQLDTYGASSLLCKRSILGRARVLLLSFLGLRGYLGRRVDLRLGRHDGEMMLMGVFAGDRCWSEAEATDQATFMRPLRSGIARC